ncbi:MAG: hypothetical protein ACXVLQ_01880 [Bacteriovorax sp.]
MKFNTPIYYCTECKTILPTIDKLLFVEENSNKGFCSEACIEDFYGPLIRHYDRLEKKTRQTLGIEQEVIHQEMDDESFVEDVLSSPSEVHKIENEMHECLYTYIRHYSDMSAIIICSIYNNQASFIFFKTLTRSRQFLAEFRTLKKENETFSSKETQDLELGAEFNEEDFHFMQLLENKKSKLLADLLVKRKDDDIAFEDFTSYESCYQETLDFPDELFETKDNEGDVFFVYIKSFIKNGQDFFYIISCLKRKDLEATGGQVNVFPVLAFPTNDMDLYREFRAGVRVSGPLKN